MSTDDRTTLYLDVDDDITAIIGKIGKADKSKVALVVPKRSNVLQSVVNLKLIKKSSKDASKTPVLISDDPSVMRLAGGLGLLTAPNLKAEPAVPKVDEPTSSAVPSDTIEGETPSHPSPTPAQTTAAASKTEPAKSAATKAKPTGDKKKKIPDFNRFKKKAWIGAAAGVLALVFLWSLFFVFPKATVLVSGTTESVDTQFNFTLDTEATKPNYDTAVLPGKAQEINKTLASTFTATGKKDAGSKASGSITIRNCDYPSGFSLSAGTQFSASGKVFVSTSAVNVPGFSGPASACNLGGNSSGKATVGVQAAENGDSYNIGSHSYNFAYSSSDVDAIGTAMSGGSSKTVTVVTAGDVENAKNQLLEKERDPAQAELDAKFSDSDYIIQDSFTETVSEVTSNPGVDQEANQAQLTVKVTYLEYGVNQAELEELIAKETDKTQDNQQLAVVDPGLEKASFKLLGKPTATTQEFQLKTTVQLGPDINQAELKQQIGGKNYSDTVQIVKDYPNVTDVDVKFSPFYVRKVPTNPKKIDIKIEVPQN